MENLNYLTMAVAFAAVVWILYEARREFATLKEASRELIYDLEVAGSVLEDLPDRETFAECFETITGKLLDLRIFGEVWDEFRESLVVDIEAGVVRSARDPYEFLGPRLLDASDVDHRRIEAVPNRLIAFGLIFTFIGLVASLLIAASGLSARDFEQVRSALNALLSAAALKFITSIAGIASSIWFTSKRSELLNSIDALSAKIGRQLDRLTAPLRADIMAEASHRELVRQSQLLEEGNDDLANAIATRLDEVLRANLADAVMPVADRIGEMSQTIADINRKALSDIIEQFSKELGGAAREHADRLERSLFQVEATIKVVPDSIKKASAAIEAAGTTLGAAADAAAEATAARLAKAGDAFAALLAQTEGHLGSAGDSFVRLADLLRGMVDRIEQTETASAERAQRAEETLRLAVEQISRVLERADTAVAGLAPLAPMAERLDQLADALRKASDTNAALISRSEQMLASSRSAGERLATTASSYSDSTAKLESSLASVFEQLASGIDLFRSRIEETVEQLDENATRIVNRLQAVGDGRASSDAVVEHE